MFVTDISITIEQKQQAALKEISKLLHFSGKTLADFSQMPSLDEAEQFDYSNHLILQELNYDRKLLQQQATKLIKALNHDQLKAYKAIMDAAVNRSGGFYFVYGYGGTGKTYLWNALASSLRSKGDIVLTVASSGIAATLLPGGRTAHSRFAIPISINEYSVCNISHNSPLANLLRAITLIIWDEAPMIQRHCVEAFWWKISHVVVSLLVENVLS